MSSPLEWLMYASVLVPIKMYINGGTNNWEANLEGKVVVITGANTGIGY